MVLLDEMEETLPRKRTLSQLLDKIVLDVLLPYIPASLNEMVSEGVWVN